MIINIDNYTGVSIGAKAECLFKMKQHGLNVPELFCVTNETQEAEVCDYISRNFSTGVQFSVRSSASAEDSSSFSFAGQLKTFLFVPADRVWERVEQCRASADTESVAEYLRINALSRSELIINVIVQAMVDVDYSGVIFTANPQGILSETVITVGAGTGDNVVEDKVAVSTYYCDRSDKSFYAELNENAAALGREKLTELLVTAEKIKELFGYECDIEYAVKDGVTYILQARPITTLHSGGHIILDSSNISESYPGISSPMTISFVKDVYQLVFSSCVRRITRDDGTAERLAGVLSNMTDAANGRIYYRISSWYDVITMLPFSKLIIPVWQEMLGVSDKSVTRSAEAPSRMTKLRVLMSFVQLISANERNMRKLNAKFDELYPVFSERIHQTDSPAELFEIYVELRDTLADCWDLTLVNDMYAFIFTGLLKHSLKCENPDDTVNQLICGSDSIESMKPVIMLNDICEALRAEKSYDSFCAINSIEGFNHFVSRPMHSAELIKRYISEYGDRCACELKLEAETYRTDPLLLVETISTFSEVPPRAETSRPKLHGLSKLYAKKAYNGILLREKSRMSRGKIFGLIREIVLKCGADLSRCGLIDRQKDVFYLRFDELEKAANGSISALRKLIASRRRQWASFEAIPPHTRIVFDSKVFDKHPANFVSDTICGDDLLIYGTPCSSGIVEGEITHISSLSADTDASGKIILADVTDPGWVFVISQSLGIISKRGSLLSHTAIISRELKKPAVVGVGNACEHLTDGDIVRLNGIDGTVQLIRRAAS
ncbi:MAG: hypothetical protein IJL33_02180 [Ruminococcus sp.]|nr:hypothetical protein [Ruminococcus sp.]